MMMNEFFLFGLLACFIFVSLIMVWVNTVAIIYLKKQLTEIDKKLNHTSFKSDVTNKGRTPEAIEIETAKGIMTNTSSTIQTDSLVIQNMPTNEIDQKHNPSSQISFIKRWFTSEKFIMMQIPIWIGAIAIIIAMAFLIKYSLQYSLLPPFTRLSLASIFGISVLFIANWIRLRQPSMANGQRIAQALSGIGIATLYGSIYVAVSIYQLMPLFVAAIAVIAITVIALLSALRFGQPIAIIGFIGAIIMPVLAAETGISSVLLCLYLYLILLSFMCLCRAQNWWRVALVVTALNTTWYFAWIIFWFTEAQAFWLSIFATLNAITIFIASYPQLKHAHEILNGKHSLYAYMRLTTASALVNHLGFVANTIIIVLLLLLMPTELIIWATFFVIFIYAFIAFRLKEHYYFYAPLLLISAFSYIALLHTYQLSQHGILLTCLIGMTIISAAFYFWLFYYLKNRHIVSFLMTLSLSVLFLVGYFTLPNFSETLMLNQVIWSLIAVLFAAYYAMIIWRILQLCLTESLSLAFVILGLTFSISIAIAILCNYHHLAFIFAAEAAVISWIFYHSRLPIFKWISLIFVALYTLSFMRYLLINLHILKTPLLHSQLFSSWAILEVAVPALLFAFASIYHFKSKALDLVKIFSLYSYLLAALFSYLFIQKCFNFNTHVLPLLKHTLIINLFWMLGYIGLWLGQRYRLVFVTQAAHTLNLFSFCYFIVVIVVINNPLFGTYVDGVAVFNLLTFAYLSPVLWIYVQRRYYLSSKYIFVLDYAAAIIVFIWLNLNIRFFFHPNKLLLGATTYSEIYSYSIIWLLLGIVLLALAIKWQWKILRYISFVLVMLSTAKIFLYDASALDGLYRVLSFLCLGFILITISYLYARFIFKSPSD